MTDSLRGQTDSLRELSEAGVAIWLDDMSRGRLSTDNLADLIRDRHVVGVTTNPTIFQKAISDSDLYDRQLRDLAVRGVDVEEAVRMVTTFDVRWGCDVLRPVYDASGGTDGRVSIEVDPRLAHETERTIAEARQLWWLVDRPNLFIKIPATKASLPAIAQCLAEGISVNVTLIFSLERYGEVMDAFIDGVERARAAGHDLSNLASVASFFVSRVDTEVDKRLEKIGSADAGDLRGKAAIANARLAFERYEQVFSGERWQALAAAGAQAAATPVGFHRRQGPVLRRHAVRRRAGRRGHRQHDARGDAGRRRGPRRHPRRHDPPGLRRRPPGHGRPRLGGHRHGRRRPGARGRGVEKFETSWNDLLASTKAELERLAKEAKAGATGAGA